MTTIRRVLPRLALVLCGLAIAGGAATETVAASEVHSLAPTRVDRGTATFRIRLRADAIRSARVQGRAYRRTIALASARRGARRGRLRVHVARRALRRSGRRLRLVLRTRAFPEFDGYSVANGSLTKTSERAYDGSRSIKATFHGEGEVAFQRVWYDVRWREGTTVWYGAAFFIPDRDDLCWWRPVRWDNYSSYEGSGDLGGLRIERGSLYLDWARYGGTPHELVGPVAVPERRWFWVEVHQRLSGTDGRALSELFIDRRRVGASSDANSAGRRIDNIRYGTVALDPGCSRPASVYIDRAFAGRHRRGPLR